MEWALVALATVAAFCWWLGRVAGPPGAGFPPALAPPAASDQGPVSQTPLPAEVSRRVADPDDPAGAFMDGYLAGRYTEQLNERAALATERVEVRTATSHRGGLDSDDADGHLGVIDGPTYEDGPAWDEPCGPTDDDMSDDW